MEDKTGNMYIVFWTCGIASVFAFDSDYWQVLAWGSVWHIVCLGMDYR